MIADPTGGSYLDRILAERQASLGDRRKGVFASEFAAAAGLSPYKTRYQLWLEKTGRVEPDDLSDKDAVLFGVLEEDAIARMYEHKNGVKLRRVNKAIWHPEHKFIGCHPDRIIVGQPKGLEIKIAGTWAANSEHWGVSGSDAVPEYYYLQVLGCMEITGLREWDVAVQIGTEYRQYNLTYSETAAKTLLTLLNNFWEYVKKDVAPPAIIEEEARQKFPRSQTGSSIEASNEILEAINRTEQLARDIKSMEAERDGLRAKILDFMGTNEVLTLSGRPVYTYRSQVTFNERAFLEAHPEKAAAYYKTTFDKSALKAADPKTYEAFKSPSSTRKFVATKS